MVNYDYRNLFKQRHIPKDMIIVDIGATVTKNSGHAPTIIGETYIFRTDDLQTESFELEESLCSEENLKWGLCEAAKVTVSVVNKPDYPTLKDEMFDVYIYMNGDSDTLLQIGRYRVETDTYSDDRRFRDLAMYDLLYYLRDYDITPWYEEMYDLVEGSAFWDITELVNSLFTWLNEVEEIPISWTSRTLPNGSFQIEKTIESDTITFEFFMQKILEINGAFGHINRKGKFVFVWLDWYDQPAVETIVDDWRKPPTTYKDQFTWGIGYIRYYDKNNINIFGDIGSSDKKHPSIYNIVDSFVFEGYEPDSSEAKTALTKMHQKIWHCRYKPFECECVGDPTIEVGDRIDVQYGTDENNQPLTFYSYVLERRFKGIQSFRDTYSAQGNKKQPKYKIDNDNWHIGDSEEGSYGYGGISTVNVDPNNFVEIIRNIGFRLLDEPSDVVCEYDSDNGIVKLLWTDPADIATSEPCEAEWAGTVVVRKENTPPLHRWDGTLIVNSTTRDQYSQSYLVNNNIEANKHYYYGIFPYDTKGDYRYTKVLSVNTGEKVLAPTISDVSMSGSKVVVTYSIPEATYSYIKLVYKKGSIPTSYTDGTAIDITQSSTSKQFIGLADGGTYYFEIFTDKSTSDPKDITTFVLNAEIKATAKNQFKLPNGEAPSVQSGTAGTYDSVNESYHFSDNCRYQYDTNIGEIIPANVIANANVIECWMVAKINSNSKGQSYDDEFGFWVHSPNSANGYVGFLSVIGNGWDDSSTYRDIARININGNNDDVWKRNAPFDDSQYQGAFHKVSVLWYFDNQKIVKIQCYIDGNLYAETTMSYPLAMTDCYHIHWCSMDNTDVKEWGVKII